MIKRLIFESICGFIGIYVLALVTEWIAQSMGVQRTTIGEWVLAELPLAVGALLGAGVGMLSRWRPTLTWLVPALFTLWEFAKEGAQDPAQWFYIDFGPHCTPYECLMLHLVEYPLFSTVAFTLTIVLWRKLVDGRVRGQVRLTA